MDRETPTSRQRRANWPVRVFHLGEEPGEDLSASTTPGERLEMMWVLRDRMWDLTGRPRPSYPRFQIPVRVIQR